MREYDPNEQPEDISDISDLGNNPYTLPTSSEKTEEQSRTEVKIDLSGYPTSQE